MAPHCIELLVLIVRLPCNIAALVTALGVVALTAPVVAEPPSEQELFDRLSAQEEREVIDLIDRGEQAYEAGEFERAAELFHDVHELFPHPDIAYQLALCHERQGNYELAIQYYRQYLERAPGADDRTRVERQIEEFEQRLGDDLSTVHVETTPAGAEVRLDDPETIPVGTTPEQLTLEPGEHRLHITREGYEPVVENVEIREGHDRSLHLQLVETAGDVDPPDASSTTSWWQPTLSVTSLLVGGVATVATVDYRRQVRELDRDLNDFGGAEDTDHNRGARDRTLEDRARAHNRSLATGTLAGALLIGGAVFTGWWAFGGDEAEPTAGVVPADDGLRLALTSRF